jgi:hypothetical protein
MTKKILPVILGFFAIVTLSSETMFSSAAPAGYTGATPGFTCGGCHASYALNSGGGDVTISGLPSVSYTAGQSYPISVTVSHGAADRNRWGFALAARNAIGEDVGTFTSTNPNVNLIGGAIAEIGHIGAVVTGASASYTYNNFSWVAPTSPTANDLNLNFYVVGNAANNNSSTSGDYIYTDVVNRIFTTVPVILSRFSGNIGKNFSVELQWRTEQEQNSELFVIERSTNGQNFAAIDNVTAAGFSSSPRDYQYVDKTPPSTNNGTIYYRLKQVDLNGRTAYSDLVTLKLKAANTIMEAPIPSIITYGQKATVRFIAAEAMPLQIIITDEVGRNVYSAQQQVAAGVSMINLPTNIFAKTKGVYFVTFQSSKSFSQTERIIVK